MVSEIGFVDVLVVECFLIPHFKFFFLQLLVFGGDWPEKGTLTIK